MGGTFDPPHLGHLISARSAAEQLKLLKVILVPDNIQPHKLTAARSPASIRLEMTRAIAKLDPLFEVSDCEISRGGVSYTVETLEYLCGRYPPENYRLCWLMGWDSALDFPTWHQPERIAELADLVALRRTGSNEDPIPQPWQAQMTVLKTPVIEISATDIRARAAAGLPIALLVGPDVESIIKATSLYQ